MNISASLQAAGGTLLTRSVGTMARLIKTREHPDEFRPLLKKEAVLMSATGVLTYFVHELFDRLILPEVSKSSLLVRNQTLWRAILSVPGLIVIELLSHHFFKDKPKKPQPSRTEMAGQGFVQKVSERQAQRAQPPADPALVPAQTFRGVVA
jgi:hypothetical protein